MPKFIHVCSSTFETSVGGITPMCINGNDSVKIKALLFSNPFPYTIGAESPVMFFPFGYMHDR
jgi:hypothetical protein